ncbi:MAG: hypothetical protein J2P48_10210 [Alphaproteobacteria bacterium]|nr:hypothetical protein [Alphaproteobacteria bacterium]
MDHVLTRSRLGGGDQHGMKGSYPIDRPWTGAKEILASDRGEGGFDMRIRYPAVTCVA